MSFLAPLFLGGLALIGLPILIHRIRRPERETVRFSSLMFVPDVPREVIERRKIQHLLLLILRVLLLLLLAFAFSRPFLSLREQAVLADQPGARHLILVDSSMSMGLPGRLAQARNIAKDLLDEIPADEKVALAAFDRAETLLVDWGSPARKSLRDALSNLSSQPYAGDYLMGLRFGERLLLNQEAGGAEHQAILHLVSDFQINAIGLTDGRLSGRIQFQGHRVDGALVNNKTITAAEVRRVGETGLQVAAKVKYWQGREPQQVMVRLHLEPANAMVVDPIPLVLEAGSASLAIFDLNMQVDQPVTGYLEISDDDFNTDNRRYFHWEPQPKRPITLVTDVASPLTRSPTWFLEQAILSGQGSGWDLQRLTPEAWAAKVENSSQNRAVILAGIQKWSPSRDQTLANFLRQGGRALLVLGEDFQPAALAAGALGDAGFNKRANDHDQADGQSILATWQWVAFDHPIFAPFGAARFNDFSQIHFYRSWDFNLNGAGARALAKTASATIMAEIALGSGTAIAWAFPPDLTWTNLPKHIKFVPILEETLQYLVRGGLDNPSFETGSPWVRLRASLPSGTGSLRLPDDREWVVADSVQPEKLLTHNGLIYRKPATSSSWQPWASINFPAREGNTEQWDVAEFAIRLTASTTPTARQTQGDIPTTAILGVRQECGYFLLLFIGLFLGLETWLAFRLSHASTLKPKQEGAS